MLRRKKGLIQGKVLKRSSGLSQGKGLDRSKRLEPKSELTSVKRLAPRSEKTKKLYEEERVPIVKKLIAERPICEACDIFALYDRRAAWYPKDSVDIHEIVSRGRGGSITEMGNLLAVCRECHDRITNSPKLAEQLGLLLPGAKNNPEGWAEAAAKRKAVLDEMKDWR